MTGLQSKLHDTGPVNENIPIPFSAGPELSQQLSSSGLISQLPAILAQAEQEVKALQAAVAELPKADHSSKTVFEFNSSCFADVPTLLLYVPVVLFFTPDVPNGCAVLQSPLLEFAADLLDLTNNVHNMLSNYCTGSLLGLENRTLPAGRLAVATLQCLSTCLDALPAQPADDMASLHDSTIRSTGKTVTKLSSCAKIAWRCMDAADLATERTVTQCKRMLFTDSSAQSNMASQRESFAAAAHLATDPCALDCLFSTVLLGLNGASNQESHGGDSSYDKDSHVGASTSLDGSQCYAQYLSLLGYSKKLFSHLTAHDNSRAFTLSSCSWFASQYLQYSHMLRIAVCQRSGQQQSYRHQELHLLLSSLMLACAASLQYACKWDTSAGLDPKHVTSSQQQAAACSNAALQNWDLLQGHNKPQAPVWRRCAVAGGLQDVTKKDPPQVPAGIVGPLVKEMLLHVLDMLSDAVQASNSTAPAAPSSMLDHHAAQAKADTACSLLNWLLEHTPTTAQHNNMSGTSHRGSALLAAAAWRKHAPKLSTVLEALVRSGPRCRLGLDPILQSSTRFYQPAPHFSDQTACSRHGRCLQLLLLDAAVAAKSTETQLQHCSLLVSLLKLSSTALAASCTTQPFDSAPAPSTGSSGSANTTGDHGHAGAGSSSLGPAESHGNHCASAQPSGLSGAALPVRQSCPPLPRFNSRFARSLSTRSRTEKASGLLDNLSAAWHGSPVRPGRSVPDLELPVTQPCAPLAAAADPDPCFLQIYAPRMATSYQTNHISSSSGNPPCAEPPVTDKATQVLLAAIRAVIAVLSANWQPAAAARISTSGNGSHRGSSDSGSATRASSSDGGSSISGSCRGSNSNFAGDHVEVTTVLQSALVSRCCMVCAEHLQQLTEHPVLLGSCGGSDPRNSSSHSSMSPSWVGKPSSDSANSSRLQGASSYAGASSSRYASATSLLLAGVANLLDAGSIWSSLVPPGYHAAAVGQALQEAHNACSSALNAGLDACKGHAVQAAAAQLSDSLAVLGRTLGAVATPLLCNNPSCSNLAGDCELHLVDRGKQKICAKCLCSRYCSVDCQRVQWKQHKHVCPQLRQLQVAGPEEVAGVAAGCEGTSAAASAEKSEAAFSLMSLRAGCWMPG